MTTPLAGELTDSDVDAYTNSRLAEGDDETIRMLAAVLSAARRDAGWHVSPVRTNHTLTLRAPRGGLYGYERVLWLPTQYVVTLKAVTVAGDPLTVGTDVVLGEQDPLQPSPIGVKLIRCTGHWSPHDPVTVTMDHGFSVNPNDPANAMDWRQAILDMVDDLDQIKKVGRADTAQVQKIVDDWRGQWTPAAVLPENNAILAKYSITGGLGA